jgi:acyl carrier protein
MIEDTAKRTVAIVADYKEMPEEEITLETTLEELDMDSLDALNLVFELEEAFDIEIPDEKAFEMKTIGEMVAGIDKLREIKDAGETDPATEEE